VVVLDIVEAVELGYSAVVVLDVAGVVGLG